jgi:uncharacterized protein
MYYIWRNVQFLYYIPPNIMQIMENTLIGRSKEQEVLLKALHSNRPEMVAVIGRRRVGKTFLIQQVFANNMAFQISGIQDGTLKEQLKNFTYLLKQTFGIIVPLEKPTSWLDAFQQLITYLEAKVGNEKQVVFFDELPWLATRRSDFLKGLSFFWNSWASQKNIVVVICGSSASWMIQKVVEHKGGLHNRLTKRVHLYPFNLYETEAFLKNRNINFNRYQIVELYLAIGGIPHYLNEIEGGLSAAQNIEQICFSPTGLLNNEFSRLYPALFENADNHIGVIKALAEKWKGLTRKEILTLSKLTDGGSVTRCLDELISSGFISTYFPFGKKKKEMLYRLTDEYSLFYLQFIENKAHKGKNIWLELSQTQEYKSWSGYAFESLCLKHIPQIKKALGISGVYAETSSFYQKGTIQEAGIQIDLLIDRKDNVINIFELKFYSGQMSLTKSYSEDLREKITLFKEITKTRKQVFLNVLTTFGLKHNEHSIGLIDKAMTMDVLFSEEE